MKKLVLSILAFSAGLMADAQFNVSLTPQQDNAIFSESSNSSGAGNIYAGRTANGNFRRALVQFDIAGNIPAGSVITAVSLDMNIEQAPSLATQGDFNIHPVSIAWGEGTSAAAGSGAPAVAPDATWSDAMFGTSTWTTAGGDFGPSSATLATGIALGTFNVTSPAMLTDVQNWYNTPTSNHGWILVGNEINNKSARRFGSKEQGVAPVLNITYTCNTPPTATCQNLTTYLDASGVSVINDSDLDGGSVAVCGGNLTFSSSHTTFTCADIGAGPIIDSLLISAVYDGPLTGGTPKGVELFAMYDIPDLSIYGVGSANNGGGSDGEEFTFPAVAVTAGSHIYLASETTQFTNFFGFAPDYTDGAMSINGDDAIELFKNGQVVDVFGDINVDGSSEPWEYLDGWAYRVDGTGADGSVFELSNWTFSSPNALDGESTNGAATTPIPIGTFTTAGPAGVEVTLTVTDEGSNSATCVSYVKVFDTLAPAVSCINSGTSFTLDGTGNLTIATGDIDNGTTDNCSLQSLTLSQTAFDCNDIGTVDLTLVATDIHGNADSCTTTINIQSSPGGLNVTEDGVTAVTCYGDTDGAINVSVTGGSAPFTFDWDNDGTGDNDDSEDLSGIAAGNYSLTVTDNAGCSATLNSNVGTPDTLQANTSSVNETCAGSMDGTVVATPSGGTSTYTYDWDMDGTGDTDDNATETNLGPGVYYVTITDVNGCTVTDSATVVEGTIVDVSVTSTVTDITAVASGAGVSYVWFACPSYTEVGATDQTYVPVANGSYAVEITDNGCVDTSACTDITELSIALATLSFDVYPNPAQDKIYVDLNQITKNTSITLMDIQGRIIRTIAVKNSKTTIDLVDCSKGVYFVSVQSDRGVLTKKIIVQ